jgi:hypothetical protein
MRRRALPSRAAELCQEEDEDAPPLAAVRCRDEGEAAPPRAMFSARSSRCRR